MLNVSDKFIVSRCRCILSPNRAEFDRLAKSVEQWYSATPLSAEGVGEDTAMAQYMRRHRDFVLAALGRTDQAEQLHALSVALGGVTVLLKGSEDMVCAGGDIYSLRERGSPRRCGGQGDILSGALAVALHWAIMVSVPLYRSALMTKRN